MNNFSHKTVNVESIYFISDMDYLHIQVLDIITKFMKYTLTSNMGNRNALILPK